MCVLKLLNVNLPQYYQKAPIKLTVSLFKAHPVHSAAQALLKNNIIVVKIYKRFETILAVYSRTMEENRAIKPSSSLKSKKYIGHFYLT